MITPVGSVQTACTPSVTEREVSRETFPYRIATIVAPHSPLGVFEYVIEIDLGAGWESAAPLQAPPLRLSSGESKEIPIFAPREKPRYQLRTVDWRPIPGQLKESDRSLVQPLLESSIEQVRLSASLALRHL